MNKLIPAMPPRSSASSTFSPLTAVSPIDGRYAEKTAILQGLFSEYGLIHRRVQVEIEWLKCLADCPQVPEAAPLSKGALAELERIAGSFSPAEAEAVKALEKMTNHDVKAAEYYLRKCFKKNKELNEISCFLHFSLTSEDVNNLAWGLILREARDAVLIPRLEALTGCLAELAADCADVPLLARTHGQPASPTTFGKEFTNFVHRLRGQTAVLAEVPIVGKLNGAVGNFNAQCAVCPDLDWPQLTEQFVTALGLTYAPCTAQIEPHDRLAELLDALGRVSRILLDLSRDAWGYVALGLFVQKADPSETGSSTMPHKVNPIDFENAEGNLGLADALARHLSSKLQVSRWQRDLSDSTALRSLGSMFGYFLIAFDSLERGLARIEVDSDAAAAELDAHWEVLAEALQTVLRRYGVADAYEQIKEHTRGRHMTSDDWRAMVEAASLPDEEKKRLLALTPATYTGLAAELARRWSK